MATSFLRPSPLDSLRNASSDDEKLLALCQFVMQEKGAGAEEKENVSSQDFLSALLKGDYAKQKPSEDIFEGLTEELFVSKLDPEFVESLLTWG